MQKKTEVFGIGNPLIDFFIKIDEAILNELGLVKGSNHYLSQEEMENIIDKTSAGNLFYLAGGSVSNTLAGLSFLGIKTDFTGTIGKDKWGGLFQRTMEQEGVQSDLILHDTLQTGKLIALITSDAERTFVTNLGAGKHLEIQKLESKNFSSAKILYLSFYEILSLNEASFICLRYAKQHGIKIALDLADFRLVKKNLEFYADVIDEYADIIFMNQQEYDEILKIENFNNMILKEGKVLVIKKGEYGSVIYHNNETYDVDPYKVVGVDTTGAGDLYASGFLYGYLNSWTFEKSGILGSYMASRIVTQKGAILTKENKDLISDFLMDLS